MTATGHAGRARIGLVARLLGAMLLAGGLWSVLTWGPELARARLAQTLSTHMGQPVTIDRLEFTLSQASVQVHGLTWAGPDPQQPALHLDAVKVSLAPWASLRDGAIVIDRLELVRPHVRVVRTGPSTFNWSPVLQHRANQPDTGPGPAWRIQTLHIEQGHLTWDDPVVAHGLQLDILDLTLHALSTLPHHTEQPARLAATLRLDGQPLRLEGAATLFAPVPSAQLSGALTDLPVATLLPYLPLPPTLRVRDGRLSMTVQADWRAPPSPDQPPTLTLAGTLQLEHSRVDAEQGTQRLSATRARLTLAPSPLLPTPALHVSEILIDDPQLVWQRSRDRAVAAHAPAPTPTSSAAGTLHIDRIRVQGGALTWHDPSQDPPWVTRLNNLTLQAEQLHLTNLNQPAATLSGKAQLSATLDDATPIDLALSLTPGQGEARMALKQLALPHWARWAGPALRVRLARGQLSAQGALRWDLNTGAWSVHDGAAQISDLAVYDATIPTLHLPSMQVRAVTLDSATRQIALGHMQFDGGRLALKRESDGLLNVMRWVQAPPAKRTSQGPGWTTRMGALHVEGLRVDYADALIASEPSWPSMRLTARTGPIEPATQRPLNLQGELKLDDGGVLQWAANVPMGAGTLQATLTMRGWPLPPLGPYLAPSWQGILRAGQLWGAGTLSVRRGPDGTTQGIAFHGGVSVNDALALDPIEESPLLRWSALAVPAIDLDWSLTDPARRRITLGDIALVNFYSRVILSREGQLNLAQLGRGAPEAAANASPPAPESSAAAPVASPPTSPTVQVGTVRIAGGEVHFTDQFIRPAYSAQLSQLVGAIEAITPGQEQPSNILITGQVDGDTPLEITGALHPFGQPAHFDVRAIAHGFDLPKISSYSGRWAGYAIEKGKLSADVRYTIRGDQLSAENRLTINQLTFGDKVDSPDAINLPLRLAVALLKDQDGNIHLDLPISGTLQDPQFSVGSLLGQALRNLVMKAVTAPFKLLAALADDTADATLNTIEFPPGASDLDETAQQRLDQLARALAARPTLGLEIVGHADPQSDRHALESAQQARPRQSQRTAERPQRPARPAQTVSDEALKELAQQRAAHARDYLRITHGLGTERLWLLAPRLSAPDATQPARRAEFTLQ